MTPAEFARALRELQREHGAVSSTPGFRNEACVETLDSLYCQGCTRCYRCTYCVRCTASSHCTHCRGCDHVHASSYCVDSVRCTSSQYLTACTDCTRCTYCYGCVGLTGAEFHILNVPYDRKTYFALVAQLES